jgi:hypothetical protein
MIFFEKIVVFTMPMFTQPFHGTPKGVKNVIVQGALTTLLPMRHTGGRK